MHITGRESLQMQRPGGHQHSSVADQAVNASLKLDLLADRRASDSSVRDRVCTPDEPGKSSTHQPLSTTLVNTRRSTLVALESTMDKDLSARFCKSGTTKNEKGKSACTHCTRTHVGTHTVEDRIPGISLDGARAVCLGATGTAHARKHECAHAHVRAPQNARRAAQFASMGWRYVRYDVLVGYIWACLGHIYTASRIPFD